MSENFLANNSVELASTAKKNPNRRQGKASKQKHQDAYREKKGAANLEAIYAKAQSNNFCDLDLSAGLELVAKLHLQQSKVEAQVPCTTRAAGFLVNEVIDEATTVAPRAVQNSGITKPSMYRVTLAQIAVQSSLAVTSEDDLQDDIIADHQEERLPVDTVQQVLTTKKTFGVLSHLVNSFGLVRNGGRTFRTYIPPHPQREGRPIAQGLARRRALPEIALNPNPFFVTIQSLRDVVTALADPQTPVLVRANFRENNPIPGAIWEGDLLTNPNDICPDGYLNSDLFHRDLNMYRRFISSAGGKMKSYLGECAFSGRANFSMFVTVTQQCRITNDGNGHDEIVAGITTTMRSQYELTDQQFIAGTLPLVGEYVPGLAFRDPTIMTSRMYVSWSALVKAILVKE